MADDAPARLYVSPIRTPEPAPETPSERLYVSPLKTAPDQPEVATLEVNGLKFEDWESVWVQKPLLSSAHKFRFTAAERDPAFRVPGVPSISKLQFKPGDKCTITMAGQLAITGVITDRQTMYDANQHVVTLSGESTSGPGARSSVDTKTGSFDNKNIQQIAQEVCAPYGIGIKTVGQLDLTPFKRMHNEKGELVWDFLERLARVRTMFMGCDSQGNLLLIGKGSAKSVGDELIEGYNIKACSCLISHKNNFVDMDTAGHGPASDDHSGTAASEMEGHAKSDVPNLPKSKIIIPLEQATMDHADPQKRADFEKIIRDGSTIQCTVLVQGWLRAGKTLWEPNITVHIYSPMAMMNRQLFIECVTFTQDSRNGTITQLDLSSRGGGVNVDPG